MNATFWAFIGVTVWWLFFSKSAAADDSWTEDLEGSSFEPVDTTPAAPEKAPTTSTKKYVPIISTAKDPFPAKYPLENPIEGLISDPDEVNPKTVLG
jgi:hypothetical protein